MGGSNSDSHLYVAALPRTRSKFTKQQLTPPSEIGRRLNHRKDRGLPVVLSVTGGCYESPMVSAVDRATESWIYQKGVTSRGWCHWDSDCLEIVLRVRRFQNDIESDERWAS